ncbi:hypothetical protein B0A48_18196 [Cryoendolithus antarcticus]|uniref:Dynein light intermediate chain n=1 Tax=Cryoendolithus antarcticus TaxID=1507870 RepID=A0A1V8S970_9PEZI|nr:hypothetical protein B0A48_18196 [Cryoendolithus antarcticus]
MATTTSTRPSRPLHDRPPRPKEKRTEIWASLLRQTRQAQARNRSNALSHRSLVLCGGSPTDQRQFLETLTRPPPALPPRRGADQRERDKEGQRGRLVLSNGQAYGYGTLGLWSAASVGVGGFVGESDEVGRVECHTFPQAEVGFEGVLRRVLRRVLTGGDEGRERADEDDESVLERPQGEGAAGRRPAVTVLLSWKEPWLFLDQLRAWLQLLARAVVTADQAEEDAMTVLKESKLSITVVVQHVEAQQVLEREGWTEETFDYVSQVLRTALLPLHPASSLLFVSSSPPAQQPGSALSQTQRAIFQALDLDLASLAPKLTGTSAAAKVEELQARHNVVDRMNILVPQGWDSVGKIRLLSEDFSPEGTLSAWQNDLAHSVFPAPIQNASETTDTRPQSPQTMTGAGRPGEEVFEASATASPLEPAEDSLPPTPSKAQQKPSAITSYTTLILDPNAHKRPKPPTITSTVRPEQDFLAEMKSELDALAAKDRSTATTQPSRPSIGLPSGESTGALNSLGDVSFNVGGVSYNTNSAEQAIERLKRGPVNVESPSPTSTRNVTPRPPRRGGADSRDVTPSAGGSGKGDFPAEDLERYFASLAKKAGGGDSRAGTPGR